MISNCFHLLFLVFFTLKNSDAQNVTTRNPPFVSCHSECEPPNKCSDASAISCFDCKNRRLATTGECVPFCPKGFYGYEETIGVSVFRLCGPCHANCDACSGPRAFQCSKCSDGHFMDTMNFFGGRWLSLCRPCDRTCATCFGIGSFTNEYMCYSCPPGFHRSRRYSRLRHGTLMSCLPCHASCQTCSGRTEYECTSCEPGFFLSAPQFESGFSRRKKARRCSRVQAGVGGE